MLRSAASDDDIVSGIVPARTVLWSGTEPAPGALRELLAECGYTLNGRDLEDWPARRVAWLGRTPLSARDKHDLSRRRIAVVHPDPGAADALAEALRARGAQAIVLSVGETGLDRAEALDPDAVILQPERFWPAGRTVIDALWQHPWLRWTPVMFAPAERLGRVPASAPDVRELAQGLQTLCASYDLCVRRASRNESFELRLSQLGPVRLLRALLESRRTLRLRLEAPERVYEIDLGEGLLIGARVSIRRGHTWEELLGVHALKSLLARLDGQGHVTPVEHPALTNIMAPLEAVLLSGHEAPALIGGDSQVTRLPQREGTLIGMPSPFVAGAPPDGHAPSAPPAAAEEEDGSPTTAFHASMRPARTSLPGAPSVSPEPLHAFMRARGRGIALAATLLAAAAGALWAWPHAERAARVNASASSALPVPFESRARIQADDSAAQRSNGTPVALEDASAPRELAVFAVEPPAAEPRDPAAQKTDVSAGRAKAASAARARQLAVKGQRLHKAGRLRAAHTAYAAALRAQPGMPRALAGLAELQLARRNPAEALATVEELLKRRQLPDDQRLLGDVYMQAGKREEAFAAYRRAAVRGNATARARLHEYDR